MRLDSKPYGSRGPAAIGYAKSLVLPEIVEKSGHRVCGVPESHGLAPVMIGAVFQELGLLFHGGTSLLS